MEFVTTLNGCSGTRDAARPITLRNAMPHRPLRTVRHVLLGDRVSITDCATTSPHPHDLVAPDHASGTTPAVPRTIEPNAPPDTGP